MLSMCRKYIEFSTFLAARGISVSREKAFMLSWRFNDSRSLCFAYFCFNTSPGRDCLFFRLAFEQIDLVSSPLAHLGDKFEKLSQMLARFHCCQSDLDLS